MLINQFTTFLSYKSLLYLFSVIDNFRFNFGRKFKFIDFREKPTFRTRQFFTIWDLPLAGNSNVGDEYYGDIAYLE